MSTKESTEVLIPFIGAFSSGKSSLLNALLGENLLSTDITPETALPIELRAGAERIYTACWPDGRQAAMHEPQFLAADFVQLSNEDGWLQAQVPHLARWPDLALVDLPGWSSGESTHERHIDEYLLRIARKDLHKNTVFIVTVSADEGTLRENVRARLQALEMGVSPYFLVLTKSDKRTPEDLDSVAEHVRDALTDAIGKPPQRTIFTSARKKQVEPLRQAIDEVRQALRKKLYTAMLIKSLLAKFF